MPCERCHLYFHKWEQRKICEYVVQLVIAAYVKYAVIGVFTYYAPEMGPFASMLQSLRIGLFLGLDASGLIGRQACGNVDHHVDEVQHCISFFSNGFGIKRGTHALEIAALRW